MARRTSTPRASRTETLSPHVEAMPLDQALTVARNWWTEHHLLDDLDADHLDHDLNQIAAACAHLGLGTYREILDHLDRVISQGAGVAGLTKFHTVEESHTVFRVRNHLGAMLAAVAQDAGHNPGLVIKHLPEPTPRAGGINRGCFDDEILLLRHRAVHALFRGGRLLLGGFQYVLVEAGALPTETTSVHADDFNHFRRPTTVTIHGATHHKKRTLTLPRWTHRPLAHAMDEHLAQDHRAATRKIAYGGGKSGNVASAAASLMLRRTMIAAGLTEDCVMPRSVVKWRVARTLDTRGFSAAVTLLGKTKQIQVQRFLDGDHRGTGGSIPESDIDSFVA